MLLFKASNSSSTPVCRVSGIPEGVGAEEGQLAAALDHAAHLPHLEPMAKFSENTLVPRIDQTSSAHLEGDV